MDLVSKLPPPLQPAPNLLVTKLFSQLNLASKNNKNLKKKYEKQRKNYEKKQKNYRKKQKMCKKRRRQNTRGETKKNKKTTKKNKKTTKKNKKCANETDEITKKNSHDKHLKKSKKPKIARFVAFRIAKKRVKCETCH